MRAWIDILNETFDSALPLRWEDHSTDDLGLVQAKFEIADGSYVVQFKSPYYNPGIWELSFVRNDVLDLTGTGSANTVLATVVAAAQEFIRERNPRCVTFAAKNDEISRLKLYPRLGAMIFRDFPQYKEEPQRNGRTHTSYTFVRPVKPYVAPEPVSEPEDQTPVSAEDLDALMAELEAEYRAKKNISEKFSDIDMHSGWMRIGSGAIFNKVRLWENPLRQEFESAIQQTAKMAGESNLRGLAHAGKVYVWDSDLATHDAVLKTLGLYQPKDRDDSFDYKDPSFCFFMVYAAGWEMTGDRIVISYNGVGNNLSVLQATVARRWKGVEYRDGGPFMG